MSIRTGQCLVFVTLRHAQSTWERLYGVSHEWWQSSNCPIHQVSDTTHQREGRQRKLGIISACAGRKACKTKTKHTLRTFTLYKQKIKQVHRGDSFLSGEISSLLLAVHPGSLFGPASLDSKQQLPSPYVSLRFLDCRAGGVHTALMCRRAKVCLHWPALSAIPWRQEGSSVSRHRSVPNDSPSPRYSFLAGLNCHRLSSHASSLVAENYLKT